MPRGARISSQSPTEPEFLQWKIVERGGEGVGADSNHDHHHPLQHREHLSGPRSASPSGQADVGIDPWRLRRGLLALRAGTQPLAIKASSLSPPQGAGLFSFPTGC